MANQKNAHIPNSEFKNVCDVDRSSSQPVHCLPLTVSNQSNAASCLYRYWTIRRVRFNAHSSIFDLLTGRFILLGSVGVSRPAGLSVGPRLRTAGYYTPPPSSSDRSAGNRCGLMRLRRLTDGWTDGTLMFLYWWRHFEAIRVAVKWRERGREGEERCGGDEEEWVHKGGRGKWNGVVVLSRSVGRKWFEVEMISLNEIEFSRRGIDEMPVVVCTCGSRPRYRRVAYGRSLYSPFQLLI